MMDNAPPPPYTPQQTYSPRLTHLPFEILLRIVQETGSRSQPWLSSEARLTCRLFYRVIQHHLRITHLPFYLGLIRPPFTSSPIPPTIPSISLPPSTQSPPLTHGPPGYTRSSIASSLPSTLSTDSTVFPASRRNETAVLDIFITALIRETSEMQDGYGDMSGWREEVFLLYQPQARLLDLLLASSNLPLLALPFPSSDLSLRFTPRKVTLLRLIEGKRKEIVKLERTRGEAEMLTVARLESALRELRGRHWMEG